VVEGGGLRVLKNKGEKFGCACEAMIMKRRDAAHELAAGLVLNAPVTIRSADWALEF